MDDNLLQSSEKARPRRWADLAAAGSAATLGMVLWLGAGQISLGAGYDRIGPRFFPYAVAAGLILVAVVLATRALLGSGRLPTEHDQRSEHRMDWGPFTWVLMALLLEVLLLERTGFVLASAGQFWLVARAFRSKKPVRDAIVAVLLSLAVYYAFSRGLGMSLP
jgi:putative tricarboxylic transport membrane protein